MLYPNLPGFLFILLATCLILSCGPADSGRNTSTSPTPQRIVSMSPNLTQIVYALGADQYLVGADKYSIYPPQAASLPNMGSYLDPDLEALAQAHPDLVLILDTDDRMVEILDGLRLDYMQFGNDTIPDILASIDSIGDVLDRDEKAAELIDNFHQAKTLIETALNGVEPAAVVLIAGRNPDRLQDIYVASDNNFLGEIIGMAGGVNAFADADIAWPQVGVEAIVAADPDVIIDSTLSKGASDEAFDALLHGWDELADLRAVRNGRIIVPRHGWFQIPGAYMDSTLLLFAHWLHPEIFPDEPADPGIQ